LFTLYRVALTGLVVLNPSMVSSFVWMDDFSVKSLPFRSYSAMTYRRSLSLGKSYEIVAPPLIGVMAYPVRGPVLQLPPSGRLMSLSVQAANTSTRAAMIKLYFFIKQS